MKSTRTWLFRGIMLTIPLLFFILLELILRLSGYGVSLPLFISTPDSANYILPRPDIVKRYFPQNTQVPSVSMEANLFLKKKPENGLRLFVQGGSTAAGFPYGLGASPAGMLDLRLKQTFPNKTVEVVNTAMSAVNSYTLLDFADEIIEQQPDGILIYAGHNEFLGILGVGSTYTAANSYTANLIFLKLKELRIFQLLQNFYNSIASSSPNSQPIQPKTQKRTLMAQVAKHKNIPINSETYQQGLTQFSNNLELLLGRYKEAGIPVFISTLASNLKDQKPFASHPLSPEDKQFIQQLKQKITLPKTTFHAELKHLLNQAKKQGNAILHYEIAKLFEQNKNYGAAKHHFQQAREHDLLRFRAPQAMNQIIKNIAIKYGATLVDYEARLAKSSSNQLIGNNFMLEHLHPNLQGYFILADSFYQSLKNSRLLPGSTHWIDANKAWKERPILPAEEYAGYAKIIQLKSDYPFREKPQKVILPPPADWQQSLGMDYFIKKINWITMMNQSFKGYLEKRNIPMVLKSSRIIADAMPQNPEANFRVGRQLLQNQNPLQAIIYFRRAVLEKPDNEVYVLTLSRTLLATSQQQEALKQLNVFLKAHPENTNALALKKKLSTTQQ